MISRISKEQYVFEMRHLASVMAEVRSMHENDVREQTIQRLRDQLILCTYALPKRRDVDAEARMAEVRSQAHALIAKLRPPGGMFAGLQSDKGG
jgi:glycosyltransferase A (GT-A) superfamily protein (DUF2064 family)